MSKLIYIENEGCDDTTCGIAEMDERELDAFTQVIKDLNRNSTYQCMPVIHIWEISWDRLVDCTDYDITDLCDSNRLYFGNRIFKFKEELWYERLCGCVKLV